MRLRLLACVLGAIALSCGITSLAAEPVQPQPCQPVIDARGVPNRLAINPINFVDDKKLDGKLNVGKTFKRGLKPTPRAMFFKIKQFSPKGIGLPASVVYVPSKLSMWLNDQYGDCVTAEEAFNQAVVGSFMDDATVLTWARSGDYLNGAMLPEVMDSMIKSGFKQSGNTYSIGSYSAVNFSDEATLQAALTIGPVKVGIDANALPSGAGNKSGWYVLGGSPGDFTNEDHCTSVCGYGPASVLFAALDTPVPPGFSATKTYYLHYTWKTIGVNDHEWLMSTCQEAFVRNPTATTNGKPQPVPGPGPQPNPDPGPQPNPQPNPNPGPLTGYTGKIAQVQEYKDGVPVGLPVTIVDYVTPAASLESLFKGTGISPLVIIADIGQILKDIKDKKGTVVIFGDLLKLAADMGFAIVEPMVVPKTGRLDNHLGEKMWARKEEPVLSI